MICHQIRLRGDDSFLLLAESTRNLLSAYVGVDFSCKTVGMRNGMAQIGLETNSSGDVLLEKEKAPLLQ